MGEEIEMPAASSQDARGFDVGASLRRQPRRPIMADADDDKRVLDHGNPSSRARSSSAFTAAAATALPPLRPRTAMTGTVKAKASSLLSTTPTNPTGMAMMRRGRATLRRTAAHRALSAVGALPTT